MNQLVILSKIIMITGIALLSGSLLQYSLFLIRQPEEAKKKFTSDYFNPSLSRINDMQKLISFTDSLASAKGLDEDNMAGYAALADSIIRMRFYYGLQNYRIDENFIANLAGKYLWKDFGAKVIPEDILKGQKAFCSQSSVVFQEMLKLKGFDVRTVKLPGHFCTEVMINGNWGFYDVSYKPLFGKGARASTLELSQKPEYLQQAYLYSFNKDFLRELLIKFDPENFGYGKLNAFAAPQMLVFHKISGFLSRWGWMLFLGAWAILRMRISRNRSGLS